MRILVICALRSERQIPALRVAVAVAAGRLLHRRSDDPLPRG